MSRLPRVEPLGDSALLVVLGQGSNPDLTSAVVGLAAHLREARLPGVTDVVPAYGSLAVFFDPVATNGEVLADGLELASRRYAGGTPGPGAQPPTHVLPVRYDGPDLAEVAQRTGLTRTEVIRRHTAPTYDVHFLGFVPGFAYLGPLDAALVLPRRAAPRRRVPAGSVAIAGAQTGVYPLDTPGGWHLIGRTDAVLFDPARRPPNLLAAGDRVRFIPLGE